MTGRLTILALIATLTIGTVNLAVADEPHQHEGDIVVGRTAAGQLAIEGDFDEPLVLPPIAPGIAGVYEGWAADEPGFEALMEDEPDEGFYMLGTDAEIWLVASSVDSPLKVRDENTLAALITGAGGEAELGDGTDLHAHLIWQIDRLVAGFDINDAPFSATFHLEDRGTTGYTASAPFTMTFVPEPASLMLLAIGGWLIGRRRR